jgi:hydrogenase maturation protease
MGLCKHELIAVDLTYINKTPLSLLYKLQHKLRSLQMSSNNTLILGIGNTLLSDEGVGIHMLDYLRRHYPALADVEYLDGGTLSFTLAAWIEEADNLIVIDAAELDSTAGTVRVFSGAEMDRFAGKTKRSVHEVSLGDLLAIAHLTDALPANRALVAIQPEEIDWGQCLSNQVKQALPVAARHVNDLLQQWSAAGTDAVAALPTTDGRSQRLSATR